MAMAARIRKARKNAVAVWVRTPLSLALERNAERPAWRRVPEPVILNNFVSLRMSPPDYREGWTRILIVDGAA
jgi:hypothetical protein